MRVLTLAAMAIALCGPLAAPAIAGTESATDSAPGPADISPEDWSAMASGRTLTYRINGEIWALERYFPGSNRVQLQLYDGSCLDGTWDYVAPHFCYHWDGQGTSCFRHTRSGARIEIIEVRDGSDTPLTQEMSAVSDTPLSCGPAVTS